MINNEDKNLIVTALTTAGELTERLHRSIEDEPKGIVGDLCCSLKKQQAAYYDLAARVRGGLLDEPGK